LQQKKNKKKTLHYIKGSHCDKAHKDEDSGKQSLINSKLQINPRL